MLHAVALLHAADNDPSPDDRLITKEDFASIKGKLETTMLPHELDLAMPVIEEIHRLKRGKSFIGCQ